MLVFEEFIKELLNFVNIISVKTILTFPDELISLILPEHAYFLVSLNFFFFKKVNF